MLMTFYDFLIRHLKNVKSHVFLKSEKNEKYVFSNTDSRQSSSIQRIIFLESTATESLLRTVCGSEFQTAGAEHQKARFTNVVVVKG